MREKFENLSSSRIEDLPAAELGELIASLQKVVQEITIAIIFVVNQVLVSGIIIFYNIGVITIVVPNFITH